MQTNYFSVHSFCCSQQSWTLNTNMWSQYVDTYNNKMSSFWHKEAFESGMKDAQAYCFWPHIFPSVDICKSKIPLFFPPPCQQYESRWRSFFLTQINKQPCYSLSEMACRDPVVGVAAGLSWWMTETLTLRSATAHILISFFSLRLETTNTCGTQWCRKALKLDVTINICFWKGPSIHKEKQS